MTITDVMTAEAFSRYPFYFRQSLRFILEIGGEEALARFEDLMSESFEFPFPTASEEHAAARRRVTEMVAQDFKTVRANPDLM